MDEILLNCYLNYKKEQNVSLWKKIMKNSVLRWSVILMILIIVNAVGAVVISMIELKQRWEWLALALEMICCVILYMLTDRYEVKNGSENMKKYISDCRKLEQWLQGYRISSIEAIQLLHEKLMTQIEEIQEDCKEKRSRREKRLQSLILPIVLVIITSAIANRTEISEILSIAISIAFGFYLIYGLFSISPMCTELLKKRRVERIKYFARELKDILDLHYYENTGEKGSMDELILVKPTEKYAAEISAYRQELLDADSSMDGCGSLRRIPDPLEWIADAERKSRKETCPEGLVDAAQFLYIRKSDERLIGMIQVRHELNDFLEKYAGHIGYSIRPSERRRGYAKRMLNDALSYCREIGLDKVMVSCVKSNQASRKTILANGGEYESTVFEPDKWGHLERYWISLS